MPLKPIDEKAAEILKANQPVWPKHIREIGNAYGKEAQSISVDLQLAPDGYFASSVHTSVMHQCRHSLEQMIRKGISLLESEILSLERPVFVNEISFQSSQYPDIFTSDRIMVGQIYKKRKGYQSARLRITYT